MTVRLLAVAEAELDEAIAWYGRQSPGLGEAFLSETLQVIRLIEQYPAAWHPLTPDIRRCRLSRFPYGVIYAVADVDIVVLAVAHLHRAPTYWKDRIPPKTPRGD
jgi:plasmid stabilization system protein ParE